jgi:transposase
MVMNTIAQQRPRVTVGVDTHLDVHVAAAKDEMGRNLASIEVETTTAGYGRLLSWAQALGTVEAFGIEGTGSYGAGVTRFLRSAGHPVIEVNRPDRAARRRNGKSDPVDAEAAARAVQSGDARVVPKSGDDHVEMIRVLRVARSTAIKARTASVNAMKALVVTAPDDLRDELRSLSGTMLVRVATRFRIGKTIADPAAASRLALRSLGRRHQGLEAEIRVLDTELVRLTALANPGLMATFGVGPEVAGVLLVTAGDNPERMHSDAGFASLCGASPVEASSGKTNRHRLNRGGDRQANAALYRVVLVRLKSHQPTKDYMAKRTTEGLSKREIIRCLKRYVARELFTVLTRGNATSTAPKSP